MPRGWRLSIQAGAKRLYQANFPAGFTMKRPGRFRWMGAALLVGVMTISAGSGSAGNAAETRPLDRWLGEWRGTGLNGGAPARLSLTWERTLGGRFVQLTLVNDIGKEPPLQRFEGLALYWSAAAGRLRGRWFDSQGATHVIDAVLEPDTLIAEWGDGTTARGRSTYRLSGPATMEVSDEIKREDGAWREFARYRLTRAGPS